MRKFILKYLSIFFILLGATALVWNMLVYFWFQNTIKKSFDPIITKTRKTISESWTEPSKDTKDKLKLFFTELEQSKDIVMFSFLNDDKSVNYTEGLRKRDHILWTLNVIYPVKIEEKIVGWIKIWPSPELVLNTFFSEKNILILVLSFLLSIALVFCFATAYFVVKMILPLSEFRKTIREISNGTSSEIKLKYKGGIWKELGESLQKLNSRVLDINTTVQMLFSVSKALTSQVDMNQIFNAILGIIQKKIPDIMCAVILLGEDGTLRVAAKRGYSHNFVKNIKIDDGNPVADSFLTGKMIIVKNLKSMEKSQVKIFTDEGAVTQINIPLIDESGTCLGVLNVSGSSSSIFEADISDTISTVGKYLSVALRNTKMYDKIQEHNRRLETEVNITSNELLQTNARLIRKVRDIKALYDISAFVSTKFNLNEMSSFIIQKVLELTSMETSAIMLEDEASGKFYFLNGSFSIDFEKIKDIRMGEEESNIIKDLKEKKKPEILNNSAEIKQKVPEFLKIIPMSSAAFIPIESNGKVAGFIISINKFGSEISDNDVNILEHIAILFSGVIEKIRLYSELENKVHDLTFLQRISSAISTAPDLEKVLEKIIDVTKDAFKADLCAVLLYDKKSGKLITQPGAFYTGGSDKVMLRIDRDDQDSLSAKVFSEGIAHLSKDATSDPTIRSHSAKDWGIKSIIIVPLINDNEVIGVLRIGKHEPNAYNEEDKNLIVMIANQAAIIIENANLYNELSTCKVK